MAIKWMHGGGLFFAIVAALYWDKPVWLDKTYQDYNKALDAAKVQRHAQRKASREAKKV